MSHSICRKCSINCLFPGALNVGFRSVSISRGSLSRGRCQLFPTCISACSLCTCLKDATSFLFTWNNLSDIGVLLTSTCNRDRPNFVFGAETADLPVSDQFRFRYFHFLLSFVFGPISFSVRYRFRHNPKLPEIFVSCKPSRIFLCATIKWGALMIRGVSTIG